MRLAVALAVFLGALGYLGYTLVGPFRRAERGIGPGTRRDRSARPIGNPAPGEGRG